MNEIARRLARVALSIKAIKLQPGNPFTWVSGYRMPIYNDNRMLMGSFEHRQLVCQGMCELIEKHTLRPEVIAGVATSGIPHATVVADCLRLPLIYVREKPKAHGAGRRIEGIFTPGQKTVVVEDLVSTGQSSVAALEGVREAGGDADTVLAIFSYGFPKAAEAFQTVGGRYFSILTYADLLEVARAEKYISDAESAVLAEWGSDPFGWGESHGFPKVDKPAA